ncbi:Putative prolin-rich exported protein (fragment) [Candidatus Sulfopaludibacter sp. SbA3]
MVRKVGYVAALVTVLAGAAMADAGDPPSRVARLNYLSGPVSFRPGSVDDWAPATLNYPLTTGDHLWTDPGAQAELHIGSTAIRMNSGTAMSILNLDDRIAQISLTEGAINVFVRFLGENESVEVDTPNVSISLLRTGDYRIQADGDNNVSVLTVRGGEAEVTGGGAAFPVRAGQREVTGGGAAFPVRAGQSARLAGTETIAQEITSASPPDMFDQWCMERERREASSVSARYVPREMVGYEDLDQYGVWTEVPQYGMVWRPRTVVAGWAPYHNGHWAWVERALGLGRSLGLDLGR